MESIKCSNCLSGWELLPDEEFCGWCGASASGFSIRIISDNLFIYADELNNSDEPIYFSFEVINTGIKPVSIDKPRVKWEP